ncbi:MAG: DEAD/DEAH box helicase [Planctomycetaceae bacterium]
MNPTTFAELKLIEPLLRAIKEENYTTPTPIQAAAIPPLIGGQDLLGCAQTGTGKTAAFALPILHRLETNRRASSPGAPRVLILTPTRELAAQIGENFQTYGRHLKFRQVVIYGGVSQQSQVRMLNRGVHIAVATPGRLLDLMEQGHVDLDELDTFVLDEADRMLDMGFLPDLKRIISQLPEDRQSLFFSATLSGEAATLASTLLRDPVRIEISPEVKTVEKIEQRVLFVQHGDKGTLLEQLLKDGAMGRSLIFTKTKRGADKVAKQLNRGGIRSDAIHGDKSQNARNRILADFRSGRFQVLVATDVAARGIDIDGITHVVNFDIPHEPENYVHRIGRTGRAGADGIALSLCDSSERYDLRAIEKLIQMTIVIEKDHPFHVERSMTRDPKPAQRGGRPAYGNRSKNGEGYDRRKTKGKPKRPGQRQAAGV